MDKIWDRKSSEVIGLCGGDEKPNDHAEPTKVERKKKQFEKVTEEKCFSKTISRLHNYEQLSKRN